MTNIQSACRAKSLNPVRSFLIMGAAAVAAFAMAPTASHAHDRSISINGVSFNTDEDLLDQLIALDADDIAELREEMADARAEIADAVLEVDDARRQAAGVPGGGAIVKAALSAASIVVSSTVSEAFEEAARELDRAERELADRQSTLSAEEFAETLSVIDMLREEMAAIEDAIAELTAAMKA